MNSLHGLVRLLLLTITASVAVTSYAQQPPDVVQSDAQGNTAMGTLALSANTGVDNTAAGAATLKSNTYGTGNVAIGTSALTRNISGAANVAVGANTLLSNDSGSENTAVGDSALYHSNSAGNTAIGASALWSNTSGGQNAALGASALLNATTGSSNTAIGFGAMFANQTASNNTAIGSNALGTNQGGSNNIAVGSGAGYSVRGGRYNIEIGNVGTASDAGTIRIGTSSQQGSAYMAGITNSHVAGSAVYITATGQLGVLASSERYKTDVASMGSSSEKVRELRPVTFHLKTDPKAGVQYGLIAEEVAKIYPELVIRGDKGQIEGVRYEELTPMLLNELQQQQVRLADQQARLGDQESELQDVRSQLADLRRAMQERTH